MTLLHSEELSLDQIYEQAVKHSPNLEIALQRLKQKKSRLWLAIATVLPTVEGQGTYLRRQDAGGGVNAAFRKNSETTALISLRQPLFQGLREIFVIQGANALKRAELNRYEWAKAELYSDIANLYFGILTSDESAKLIQEEFDLTGKRVKDLLSWEKLGRSRSSERLSAQAQSALLQTQLRDVQQASREARNSLEAVSGIPADSLTLKEDIQLSSPDLTTSLERVAERADIKALQEEVTVAKKGTASTWTEYIPTLDAEGNYYLKRSGVLEDVKWDIALQLTVPILSGGSTWARRQEMMGLERQRELEFQQAVLNAKRDVRNLHERLSSLNDQIDSLKKATDISEKSYRAQLADYRRSLVTNFDVLESLRTYVETKRQLKVAEFDRLNTIAQISVSATQKP